MTGCRAYCDTTPRIQAAMVHSAMSWRSSCMKGLRVRGRPASHAAVGAVGRGLVSRCCYPSGTHAVVARSVGDEATQAPGADMRAPLACDAPPAETVRPRGTLP